MRAAERPGREEDGIRIHRDESVAESDATLQRFERLIADAKALGCLEALRRNDTSIAYLTDPARLRYIDHLGIDAPEDVLEIGCSMGQHTRVMAPRCRRIAALDVVPMQAKFARVWCDEDGLDNVSISAGGAKGTLPYDDASFDLVTLNYVLEWSAGRAEDDPTAFHRRYLAEIARVLRPGGRLFLSTKNRYSLKYVLGQQDEHLGIRFGSALPRWLQHRRAPQADPDKLFGHLHSRSALEALLREAGFGTVRQMLAFPDSRYPLYMGDFDGFDADKLPAEGQDRIRRIDRMFMKLPRRLQRELTNSLVFMATKPPGSDA